MPIHPTLFAILAEWKLAGWESVMGRRPDPQARPGRPSKGRGRRTPAGQGKKKPPEHGGFEVEAPGIEPSARRVENGRKRTQTDGNGRRTAGLSRKMRPFATAIRPDATASVYQVYQAIISASGVTSSRSAIDVVRDQGVAGSNSVSPTQKAAISQGIAAFIVHSSREQGDAGGTPGDAAWASPAVGGLAAVLGQRE